MDKAREYNVKFIRLQFTDIFGVLKNIAITVEDLPRVLDRQIVFDSSVIEGVVGNRETDIFLHPDPSTFVIFPWRPREGAVARLICDIYQPDGSPFESCPRHALKSVQRELALQNLQIRVGSEVEFFLFQNDDKGRPTTVTHDQAGYCDLTPVDRGENARRDMVLTLEEMGFEIGSSHHELAPGQHEIILKFDDALAAADKFVTFKFVVRTIAQRHGLHASFMPKPLMGVSGSGLHWHFSIFRGEDNILDDPASPDHLSDLARKFIAGLITHAPSLTAITNPIVNSYKRLIPSSVAPVYIAWSEHNRNCMIRIPSKKGENTRLEVRSPDPTCNPYLGLAVLVKAGLDGVINGLIPPAAVVDNMFGGPPDQQASCLPRTLEHALQALQADPVTRVALGEDIYQRFYNAKMEEWARYQAFVHPWELNEYLMTF
ncbi:MAG: type I glutamate--ammonia ligase [Bacillota bacterium]